MARHIVGIGGTFRPRSSSEMLVRAVLTECEELGARTTMFDGPALAALPHFNPERPERTPEQAAFVAALRAADGLVIGTPGYHGGVSGVVKNAIDLLEDLRGDDRVYFDGMPVGIVATAAGWQAAVATMTTLRTVAHALRGWPTPVGVAINTVEDGAIDKADGQLRLMVEQMIGFVAR